MLKELKELKRLQRRNNAVAAKLVGDLYVLSFPPVSSLSSRTSENCRPTCLQAYSLAGMAVARCCLTGLMRDKNQLIVSHIYQRKWPSLALVRGRFYLAVDSH